MAAALSAQGVPAQWIDPRRLIVTDNTFTSASPRSCPTRSTASPALSRRCWRTAESVTGGFVAATPDGITTTLGRGGSDYSASIVGAGIGADEIQIWTDVDGMLTADPRIFPEPQLVPQLSFEAAELAYFGAKVLHPKTIQPALSRAIPVRILNSRRPEGRGTRITAASDRGRERPVAAFASKRHVTVVDVTSSRMLEAYEVPPAPLPGVREAPDLRGRRDDLGGECLGDD